MSNKKSIVTEVQALGVEGIFSDAEQISSTSLGRSLANAKYLKYHQAVFEMNSNAVTAATGIGVTNAYAFEPDPIKIIIFCHSCRGRSPLLQRCLLLTLRDSFQLALYTHYHTTKFELLTAALEKTSCR